MLFEIKSGDTGPALRVQLLDAKKKPVPINGAVVTFRMSPKVAGLRASIDATAIIVDDTLSIVEFQWRGPDHEDVGGVGDTDVAGLYRADFYVLFGGVGPGESFPNDEDIDVLINPKP